MLIDYNFLQNNNEGRKTHAKQVESLLHPIHCGFVVDFLNLCYRFVHFKKLEKRVFLNKFFVSLKTLSAASFFRIFTQQYLVSYISSETFWYFLYQFQPKQIKFLFFPIAGWVYCGHRSDLNFFFTTFHILILWKWVIDEAKNDVISNVELCACFNTIKMFAMNVFINFSTQKSWSPFAKFTASIKESQFSGNFIHMLFESSIAQMANLSIVIILWFSIQWQNLMISWNSIQLSRKSLN